MELEEEKSTLFFHFLSNPPSPNSILRWGKGLFFLELKLLNPYLLPIHNPRPYSIFFGEEASMNFE